MRISVKAHIKDVISGLNDLEKKIVPRVVQQALNKAGATVTSTTKKELPAVMNLRVKKTLNGIVVLHKAVRQSGEVAVTTSDHRGLGLETTANTIVQVTNRGKGKSNRQITKVLFKGKTLDGAFRIKQIGNIKGGIFTKGEGKYGTGNRRVKRLFAFPATQELIHARIDQVQERIGTDQFAHEFDVALANELRKLRM